MVPVPSDPATARTCDEAVAIDSDVPTDPDLHQPTVSSPDEPQDDRMLSELADAIQAMKSTMANICAPPTAVSPSFSVQDAVGQDARKKLMDLEASSVRSESPPTVAPTYMERSPASVQVEPSSFQSFDYGGLEERLAKLEMSLAGVAEVANNAVSLCSSVEQRCSYIINDMQGDFRKEMQKSMGETATSLYDSSVAGLREDLRKEMHESMGETASHLMMELTAGHALSSLSSPATSGPQMEAEIEAIVCRVMEQQRQDECMHKVIGDYKQVRHELDELAAKIQKLPGSEVCNSQQASQLVDLHEFVKTTASDVCKLRQQYEDEHCESAARLELLFREVIMRSPKKDEVIVQCASDEKVRAKSPVADVFWENSALETTPSFAYGGDVIDDFKTSPRHAYDVHLGRRPMD